MADIEMWSQNCPECDIRFSIPKSAEKSWRDTHKTFFCPNGHTMSWPGESAQTKELKELRAKVIELQAQLDTAKETIVTQTKRVDELNLELEIYKPAKTPEIT